MNYTKVFSNILDVVGVAGVITGQPEITAVTKIISGMLEDDVDNKEFLRGLSDDELRQLIYSTKEELASRRK